MTEMSIAEIETVASQLPPNELDQLMERLEEMRQEKWDQQIARDWENGRFDEAIARAKKDCAEGRCTPL